ncbi:UDP-glucose 4-epimerase GalE [Nitrosomonas supralitoralis]|uniref:UDP-glucose 4-epimerase n=1 Tax=Nitrosomonas supralitoralis TaxID=2116706 RepID=A0A2P7NYP0_9PROT|nr:UDP-glucose 4-epimerase GalE [Nitrosomonas supralitoralis]PSJ18537.1 UDP-glucose 4-epimerase GalE [Nitrosomonas supralitoralis]
MILVTGGAGYIGSHTCVELLNAGFDVTVFDNFCNSSPEALARVAQITGKKPELISGDCRDQTALVTALKQSKAKAVIHFAGLKAVGESVEHPLSYYDNNVAGTLRLLEAMQECNVKTLVFSSSATVYGNPVKLPLTEDHPLSPTNPYGRSKLMIEEILRDLQHSDPSFRIGILRYFNPVGAHPSGLIGEDPQGKPNNLMPFVAQVAIGRRDVLSVWGNDYPTADGTGVRDYIHVVDLALGHLKALEKLGVSQNEQKISNDEGCLTVNLGTGRGYSVLEVVRAYEQASGRSITYRIAPRRSGDIASCYANPERAYALLGWRAKLGLNEMCAHSWHWQYTNPNGY